MRDGKTSSSSRSDCTQFMSASTYSGAGRAVGFLYVVPSSKRNSNLKSGEEQARSVSCFCAWAVWDGMSITAGKEDCAPGAGRHDGTLAKEVEVSAGPQIELLTARAHRLLRAELGDRAVEHVDVVEEVDDWRRDEREDKIEVSPWPNATKRQRRLLRTVHGNPLVFVLSVRQPYGSSEVARALKIQREASAASALGEGRDAQERRARGQLLTADTHKGRLCKLLELVLLGSRGCLLGLECCKRG